MRALLLLALLCLVPAGCAHGPKLQAPSCGGPCCLGGTDELGQSSQEPCDGEVFTDPDLGDACRRPDGVVEACAG